jgi:hypothetical protein
MEGNVPTRIQPLPPRSNSLILIEIRGNVVQNGKHSRQRNKNHGTEMPGK